MNEDSKGCSMKVSIKALKAALLCVANTDNVRSYLCNIYVNGVDVVATNGHIAYVDNDPDLNEKKDCFAATIPCHIISELLKNIRGNEGYIVVDQVGKSIALKTMRDTVVIPLDSTFVEYRNTFARKVQPEAIAEVKLNTEYLEILHKVNKIVRGRKGDNPIITFTGNNRLAVAYWEAYPNARFYIMPYKL